jgi:KDO2-lipid IV(A) lauroyltransferase
MNKKNRSKRSTSILFWIIWNIARALPLPAAARVLSSMGRILAGRLTRQHTIRENLTKAFPEMTPEKVERVARNVAANLGVVAAELCHIEEFRGGIANGTLTFDGGENLLLAKNGPVIFVGTHQWNWEIAPLFYVENGVNITLIYANFGNELLDRTILAARKKTGANYLERRNAVRTGMNILEQGRSLAFLMDQRVKSGIAVSFFGRQSLMTSFPARLALRFRCPIVPIDMERRDGHRFHMFFCRPIYPPAERGAGAELQMTQAIATEFERIIRRSPETWFCNKRRWPD